MMRRMLLGLAVAAGVAGPAAAQSEAALNDFLTGFLADFENLDWQRFRARFSDDSTVFFPPQYGAARATGRAETDPAWLRTFEVIRSGSGRTAAPFMRLLPQDLLVQEMPGAAVVTFALGGGVAPLGRRTLVLRREAEGWRIVHLHGSTIPPGR
ncbi:nuclear transport factor 2 family protein [Roseomonas sp. CCTCC AB2023176]|uniref:nuclear transport factor 2 family protein n=1 Tax=Roseomonas sp. CCTCC AB2023176 TaxID=3342640 RepID=UPI0035D92E30